MAKSIAIQPPLFKGARRTYFRERRSEHSHQVRFIQWCLDSARMQGDPLKAEALRWIHSIPNGAYTTPKQKAKLKAEGLTPGVHDLRVDWVRRDAYGRIISPGMIIEMKLPGEKYTPEQLEYKEFMEKQGFTAVLARNWQEAAVAVIEHLELTRHAGLELPCARVQR